MNYTDTFGASEVKNPPAKQEMWVQSSGSGRFPAEGHGNPLQYSCPGNPVDRGAWWVTVHGAAKSQTQLSMHACLLHALDRWIAGKRKKEKVELKLVSPPFRTPSIVLGPAGLSPWVLSPHLPLATRPFLIKCHYTRGLIASFLQRGRKTGEAVNRPGQSHQKLSAEGMGVYLSLLGERGIKGCGVGAACQQS